MRYGIAQDAGGQVFIVRCFGDGSVIHTSVGAYVLADGEWTCATSKVKIHGVYDTWIEAKFYSTLVTA